MARSLNMVRFQCDQIKRYLAEHPTDNVLFATTKPDALLEDVRGFLSGYDLTLVADGVKIRNPVNA